jgi:hypothetical protein
MVLEYWERRAKGLCYDCCEKSVRAGYCKKHWVKHNVNAKCFEMRMIVELTDDEEALLKQHYEYLGKSKSEAGKWTGVLIKAYVKAKQKERDAKECFVDGQRVEGRSGPGFDFPLKKLVKGGDTFKWGHGE